MRGREVVKVDRAASRLMELVDELAFAGCDDLADAVLDAANMLREAADEAHQQEREMERRS